MSNTEILTVNSLFISWLKLELAYQHGLTDFMGMENAFDSDEIPTQYLKHSPIHSVKDNEDLRVQLMETALYKDKAHREYTKLYEFAQSLISKGIEIQKFKAYDKNETLLNRLHNMGFGFLNYLKLKNEEEALYKKFRHSVHVGNTENMLKKQKEWGEATTRAIDQYHALLDSAYIELGVKDQTYEVVGNEIKKWMATA